MGYNLYEDEGTNSSDMNDYTDSGPSAGGVAAGAATTVGTGIATGAAMGSAVPIVGSVIGAGVGAATTMFDHSSQKKKDKKAMYPGGIIPKHRFLQILLQQGQENANRRIAGMGMLAQAAFDWGSSIR